MTEQKWLKCTDPFELMRFVVPRFSERKQTLLRVASARMAQAKPSDRKLASLIDLAEADVDNLPIDWDKFDSLCESAMSKFQAHEEAAHSEYIRADGRLTQHLRDLVAKCLAADEAYGILETPAWWETPEYWSQVAEDAEPSSFEHALQQAQLHLIRKSLPLIRDIFGNPFRPVKLDPRWPTATVVDLAGAIYEDRAFERMPILADALMDAGCDSEQIINHCRGEGPHVRGCWVVDLLLGKE